MTVRQADHSRLPIFAQFRGQHIYPSLITKARWENLLLILLGHYWQCRRAGNRRATVLCDHDYIILALYRVTFPKLTAAEINAFLFHTNFGNLNFRFYSPSQISKCKNRIGLTRKRGGTTAFQALLPVNRRKRFCIGTSPTCSTLPTFDGAT